MDRCGEAPHVPTHAHTYVHTYVRSHAHTHTHARARAPAPSNIICMRLNIFFSMCTHCAVCVCCRMCTCPRYCWDDPAAAMFKNTEWIARVTREAIDGYLRSIDPVKGLRTELNPLDDLSSTPYNETLPLLPDVAVQVLIRVFCLFIQKFNIFLACLSLEHSTATVCSPSFSTFPSRLVPMRR